MHDEKDLLNLLSNKKVLYAEDEDGIQKNFPEEFRTKETADLFLQLIIEVLKENGRAAVVLPDGTLFGEGVKTKIKKLLLDTCNLHTVVRLPNSVFAPYTGIKTNILFFEKANDTIVQAC